MSIAYNEKERVFQLDTAHSSYLMQIMRDRYLAHLGWFGRIREWAGRREIPIHDRSFSPNPDPLDRSFSLDSIPLEYSAWGRSDLRPPALRALQQDGSSSLDLLYREHRIIKGKPALEGLPSVYTETPDEADTLVITLEDPHTSLLCDLSYTVFKDRDVITRSTRIRNQGDLAVSLHEVMSMCIDFDSSEYRMLQLSGAHNRERHIYTRELYPGSQSIDSRRGASSHQQNPFLALLSPNADEDAGVVYGFNLVYSGNFIATVHVDQFDSSRVLMGINPFDFQWELEAGETFQTPEVVMVRSTEGLGGMSRTYHDLYRERLVRGPFRGKERPVLINNWEATYFDFDSDTILKLADEAASLGMELFVLDDGWFGSRDDDLTSLGDWFPHTRKLPYGIKALADKIIEKGLQFGIWFEPEMISEKSLLFAEHPDWCLQVPGRKLSAGRSQLILDYSREDVREYIIQTISVILDENPISYVKWDMNRHMTEVGSLQLAPGKQRETAHRYMLGLYEVLERVTSAFPAVLFESCSGGGGRFDPGMLHYMPQTWTSDNTDPISRLAIQEGTAMVYPPLAMGAHVSASPNHQTGRETSLKLRGAVAMGGNFGYELNLLELSDQEKEEIREQVSTYKRRRHLITDGDRYRLTSPLDRKDCASWMTVSPNRDEAWAVYVSTRVEANHPYRSLRLKGLDPQKRYCINGGPSYGGDELMEAGINLPYQLGENEAYEYYLEAVTTRL